MYEFNDKEIREGFKETEYGRKVDKMFWTATIFGVILIFVIPIIGSLIILLVKAGIRWFWITMCLYAPFHFIGWIAVLYFDGKRDGAIEMYKCMLNNQNNTKSSITPKNKTTSTKAKSKKND